MAQSDNRFMKCEFVLKNNSKVIGWLSVSDYVPKTNMLLYFKNKGKQIEVYNQLFFPKFAKSFKTNELDNYLRGRFACSLNTAIKVIDTDKIKTVRCLSVLDNISATLIVSVNNELLNLLIHKNRNNEYTIGHELISYTFFNYNNSINKIKLKALSATYFEELNRIQSQAKDELDVKKQKTNLIDKYLKLKIIVVDAYGLG